ncbi:MAG: efflux RND transporter periplasmic adaptor subunit [Deltaproteobacteria bacterium]
MFVEMPMRETVTEREEFTGQTMARETIEIRARVSGYLEETFFKDGDFVKEGDLLFRIDPRPYHAEFKRTEATLGQAEAHLKRLKRQEERAVTLLQKKAISEENFDQARFDREEAEATVDAARAAMEKAKLDLDFTAITSKISGRISRRMVDPGNLVQADFTPLTTVVSLDPMFAYFDVDERTLLRLRRMTERKDDDPNPGSSASGDRSSEFSSEVRVAIALADGEPIPQGGKIDFLDNQVEATSGTLRARVVIDNKDRMLSPGLFVRLRVPIGTREALLIHEEALQTNQGQRFVWVLNENDEAIQKPVTVGWLEKDGRRVILEGLESSDRIIVRGVQRVRDRKVVNPRPLKTEMTKSE